MGYLSTLQEEVKEKVEQVQKADILIGIPSYNNERTIGQVIRAAQCGLAKYFPDKKAVIMNSDAGSKDRTREIVEKTSIYTDLDTILVEHPVNPARSLITPYHGLAGKGSAYRTIFEVACELDVDACIVLDSDLKSITPEWMQLLAGPILMKGYDYVAPYYSRHKYEATITNSIVYPLTRALYGKSIRQPIGGDFGFSKQMMENFLSKDIWGSDTARYGIDIWMTTTAINEGFKICQSFLGAKIHYVKDSFSSLSPMFKQVVGTLFYLMTRYEDNWRKVKRSRPTVMYGFPSEVFSEPVSFKIDLAVEEFRSGVEKNRDYWYSILSKERVKKIEEIASLPLEKFNFPPDLWVKTIYDFAIAYKISTKNKSSPPPTVSNRLICSLLPLYFGQVASFAIETSHMSDYEAEVVIEKLCQEFEKEKPYLVERWFK